MRARTRTLACCVMGPVFSINGVAAADGCVTPLQAVKFLINFGANLNAANTAARPYSTRTPALIRIS